MQTPHRQLHPALVLVASFFIFIGSFILNQVVRCSDLVDGIVSGLCFLPVSSIGWILDALLPGLLIYALYRWRRWKRFQAVAILSPALATLAFIIAGFIFDPPTPAHRLKKFTGADLPLSAHDLRTHFSGGGLADFEDTYFFRCSPADTEKLIKALDLSPASMELPPPTLLKAPFPSWPDPGTWSGSTLYQGWRDEGAWSYDLRTDPSREQVYLQVSGK